MSKKQKSIWDVNPELKAYHQTSDGNKFHTEETAKTHARSLKNKDVKKVSRPSDAGSDSNDKGSDKKPHELRAETIAKLETVDAVKAALKDETSKTVIKAGEARIEVLEASDLANGAE